ncbi:MAG TPA: hypothetical protein PLM14_09080 [Candidatus Hydrogenedentes bacterium]|nr:hypothetical protein [Candidatus Hydrogenedentota bacterium]HQH52986.1 hypothetical protein [Candidatus Hydrogenedentota bacterium]
MNVVFLALLTLLAGIEDAEPRVARAEAERAAVERVLEGKPALLAEHRGFLSWLEMHPSTAAAEEAFVSLMLTQGFSLPANRYDESLVRFPEAASQMDGYYDFLASDSGARAAIDDLHRFELAHRTDGGAWGAALSYLRANPAEASTFLVNPRWVKPMPEALQPLADAARKHEPSVERLRTAFQTLDDNALAHLRVFPWWETAYDAESPIGGAFEALNAHFRQYPHRFWVWHRRELALADDPGARAWIRHWHRIVRRSEGLDRAYWVYLDALRGQPERAQTAETRWQKEHGAPPQWPPDNDPPSLTPLWLPSKEMPSVKRLERLEIETPPRPLAPGPDEFTRPTLPTRPARPTRPVKEQDTAQQSAGGGQ